MRFLSRFFIVSFFRKKIELKFTTIFLIKKVMNCQTERTVVLGNINIIMRVLNSFM